MDKMRFEQELLRTVAADLQYVACEWSTQIDDDSLRRDCVVLHKLLVEGELGRAWRVQSNSRRNRRFLHPCWSPWETEGEQISFRPVEQVSEA